MSESIESNELFQKYCVHLGGCVSIIKDERGDICLCSNLCHSRKCENKKINVCVRACRDDSVEINEK